MLCNQVHILTPRFQGYSLHPQYTDSFFYDFTTRPPPALDSCVSPPSLSFMKTTCGFANDYRPLSGFERLLVIGWLPVDHALRFLHPVESAVEVRATNKRRTNHRRRIQRHAAYLLHFSSRCRNNAEPQT